MITIMLFFKSKIKQKLQKVLPVVRGEGVYQKVMNEILNELNKGEWLHLFPEGKVNETKSFLRLKWGVGRLVADAQTTPIVLPFYHFGLFFYELLFFYTHYNLIWDRHG